jgi:hypothetical protein
VGANSSLSKSDEEHVFDQRRKIGGVKAITLRVPAEEALRVFRRFRYESLDGSPDLDRVFQDVGAHRTAAEADLEPDLVEISETAGIKTASASPPGTLRLGVN